MSNESKTVHSIPNWLTEFTAAVPCSPGFIVEMDKQLGESFKEMTELDLNVRFQFYPPFPEPFKISKDDSTWYVEGYLHSKKMGYQVVVAWKGRDQEKDNGRDLRMEERVTVDNIQFWWSQIDAAGMVAEETKKPELYFDPSALSFPIENEVFIWPDINMDIRFGEELAADAVANLSRLLGEAQEEWNQDEEHEVIHFIGEVNVVDNHRLSVFIDLGSAGPDGLEYLLHKLDDAALGITKVRVYI
jgi:hypothetical protein